MQDFRRLEVWRKAHLLTLDIYRETGGFPDNEKYGLVSQMRRCAASVPCNIAEGAGRATRTDFARFLDISIGSAMELDYQILLAHDLGIMLKQRYMILGSAVREVQRMLVGLKRSLRDK